MNKFMSTDAIPEVSICIPVYKEKDLLERCLLSINNQAYKKFEVIISDDTPSDLIETWLQTAHFRFNLYYHKNEVALGSPSNWNNAIRYARGKYIKIMHQDDWFANNDSLGKFVSALENNPNSNFAFAVYRDYKDGELLPPQKNFEGYLQKWASDKSTIVAHNFIGDPSTSIFRNGLNIFFDERLKWCVDFDFYLSIYEQNKNIHFINEHLINIGTHAGQITHTIINNASVVVYEHIILLNKYNIKSISLKHFDTYWRMLRNFKIRTCSILKNLAKEEALPSILQDIISVQSKIPFFILQNGVVSKLGMFICYLMNRVKML